VREAAQGQGHEDAKAAKDKVAAAKKELDCCKTPKKKGCE